MAACLLRRISLQVGLGVIAVALATVQPWGRAQAQDATAQVTDEKGELSFNLPPQPLTRALTAYAKISGVRLAYDAGLTKGRQSTPLNGNYTPEQALEKLLNGTPLVYRFTGDHTVAIFARSAMQDNAQSLQLETITVEGDRKETATGPVKGYVARRSATGTKTDAPLIETPQSISVVTRDQIDAQQATTPKQALNYSAGVNAENRGAFNGYDIIYSRGFSLDRYLDGMKLQGNAGYVTPQIDLYSVERVELLRGPASVLYGQGSPGGMLNLVSKQPTATPFHEIQVQGGTFDRRQAAFDFSGPIDAQGVYQYRLVGLARASDNQVDYVQSERYMLAPSFKWQPTADTSLTVLANLQHDPKLGLYNLVPRVGSLSPNPNGIIPRNFYTGDPNYNKIDTDQASIGYRFEHSFNNMWTVRQSLRYFDTVGDLNQVLPNGLSNDGRTLNRYAQKTREHTAALTSDNQLEAKFLTGPLRHTALFGVDYQQTLFDQVLGQAAVSPISVFNPVYNVPIAEPATTSSTDQRSYQTGAYFQDQIKFENLVLLGSLRNDRAQTDTKNRLTQAATTQNDHATTGRVGAVYLTDIGLAPFVSYATSFSPQSGTAFGGAPFVPTTGVQKEAGIKYQPKNSNSFIQVSAFELRQQNVLTQDTINGGNFRVQTGEITSRGIEFEAKASINDSLNLTAAYTYLDAKVTQSNSTDLGRWPLYIPRHTASGWVDYTFRDGSIKGFGLGGGLRYIGPTFGDTINTVEVGGYVLADATAHYELENLDRRLTGYRLSVNAQNLFDKTYVSQCTNANCLYGVGRVVLATLRYRW